ncbi:hypothetical protein [Xanthomonas campestris]|uniref:hypothetical protein n=1 Tax=Xanthomonas campestris TaxID=339 RepID=UPI000E0EAE25|nr:hypothetical protein [Xanthomonas campestris]MEA9606680.1 hypothetical protein [Xanthomonas campestris pv. plantaginis]
MHAAGSTLLAMQMCTDAPCIDIALVSVSDQDGWRGALTASEILGGMDAAKDPYLFGFTACPGGGEGIAHSSCWRLRVRLASLVFSHCESVPEIQLLVAQRYLPGINAAINGVVQ